MPRASVGGVIEPFAFGGEVAPAAGLPAGTSEGPLRVPAPKTPFALEDALAASSWVPGEMLSVLQRKPTGHLNDLLGLQFNYWPPADAAPRSEPYMFGDGGNYENVHMIGLLKRKVRSIVAFFNGEQPLHAVSRWDPATTPPDSSVIDDDIPPFFGVISLAATTGEAFDKNYTLDLTANQVFDKAGFVPLVQALQAAMAAGGGVAVTTPQTTVANARWGIEAGHDVNVTWVYLSRLGQWEDRLPAELRAKVKPNVTDPDSDYGNLVTGGPYAYFPLLHTSELRYSVEKANLLADMTGWGVLNQADVFRRALAR